MTNTIFVDDDTSTNRGEDWDAYITNMLGMNQMPVAGSGGDGGSEGLYAQDAAV